MSVPSLTFHGSAMPPPDEEPPPEPTADADANAERSARPPSPNPNSIPLSLPPSPPQTEMPSPEPLSAEPLSAAVDSTSDAGKPRADHTSLPPELWLEIFRYATHVPRARSISPGDPFVPERPVDYVWGMNSPIASMRTKCTLVRVCRAWRAIATELLYEHVVLSSPRRLDVFYRTLLESRKELRETESGELEVVIGQGYGQWVRHLEVQRWMRAGHAQSFWQAVVRAVSFCSRIRVLSGLWQEPLPDGFLPVFARYLPPTLEEIYWQQDSVLIAVKELPLLTTSMLASFPAIRVLDLRKICVLDAERSLQHVTFGSLSLPNVRYLALPTCPFLLRYASKQDLPALHHLVLDAAGAPRTVYAPLATKELVNFLELHGQKLRTVELLPSNTQSLRPGPISISAFLAPNACPNLETLVFDCREKVLSVTHDALLRHTPRDSSQQQQQRQQPSAPGVTSAADPAPAVVNLAYFHAGSPSLPLLDTPHTSLRRVGLRGVGISKLYPNRPAQAQAHLEALAAYRVLFPALEVVRTLGFLVGTSTDPFAPDVFIWWTEKFERVGVDLQDGESVVWMLEDAPPEAQTEAGGKTGDGEGERKEGRREMKEAEVQTEETMTVGASTARVTMWGTVD
ncbi:hypothetical protein LXA43DRAFT_990962 [Ganoderma leucocontextum]|nr:hypothetical protein LXA43DRAFT_990962 [Ganoderma leucocontextum]